MTVHAIASKYRRALRKGTGASFTYAELVELVELGAMIPFGLFPTGYAPPPPPITGHWPLGDVVYFIGPIDGPVKIGSTNNLRARWRHLKYMSPSPLHVWATCPGTPADEREYHRRFAACRLHGEWFDRTDELVAEIERLREMVNV